MTTQQNFFNPVQSRSKSSNEPVELQQNVVELKRKLGWIKNYQLKSEEDQLIHNHCVEVLNVIYKTREAIVKNDASTYLDKALKKKTVEHIEECIELYQRVVQSSQLSVAAIYKGNRAALELFAQERHQTRQGIQHMLKGGLISDAEADNAHFDADLDFNNGLGFSKGLSQQMVVMLAKMLEQVVNIIPYQE